MIISRYLTREVFSALFVVITVLLLAFLSQQVVRYMNYVAIGKIPTNVLLELISFEVPYLLALLLPLGLYLGVLLAYGRLFADNEMSIMQMCGYGNKRVMKLTAMIATVVSAAVLMLMFWVNPIISAKRDVVMSSDEATLHLIQTLIPGRFEVSPDGHHVMYVEKLSRDHNRAKNVFMAEEKKSPNNADQDAWMLVLANEGYQIKDTQSADQFFVTEDGYRYEGTPGQNDYKIIQYKKYAVRIQQTDARGSAHLQEETLSTSQLLQNYNDPKHAAEFQWRLSIALSVIMLALLAVPLSALRPRQGRYLVLLPAVLVYIVYIELLFVARHWVELAYVPVWLGMWWVHVLMLIVTSLALYLGMKRMTGTPS